MQYGIDPKSLTDQLFPVTENFNSKPVESLSLVDLFSHQRAEVDEWLPENQEWDEDILRKKCCYFPMFCFDKFTFDEICKTEFSTFFQSSWHDTFRGHPSEPRKSAPPFVKEERYMVVNKLRLSMWHWGGLNKNWNSLVRCWNGIKNFEFGDDFEVRLDHSTFCNESGWSEWAPRTEDQAVYLDGELGFLIFYKSKHVLTIGWSASAYGILIQQVQLKNKKGNRWLYKFPNLMEHVVNQMQLAFNCDIWLVQGKSLADGIKANYTQNKEMSPEAYKRVVKKYSQPLRNFERGEKMRVRDYFFNKIVAKHSVI
jgi:hypothetical protein